MIELFRSNFFWPNFSGLHKEDSFRLFLILLEYSKNLILKIAQKHRVTKNEFDFSTLSKIQSRFTGSEIGFFG